MEPSSPTTVVKTTPEERWELYRILDLRNKLRSGLAYIQEKETKRMPPSGEFPEGTRSQMVNIRLKINDYLICVAHRYAIPGGRQVTGPDPKYIRLDDLALRQ